MFKKNCVDLIYRVICLCTFIVVIIFSKSLITLSALTIFFFFITKEDNDFLFIFLYLLSVLFFTIAYFVDDFALLKIISIIEFSYYFLNIPRVDKLLNDKLNVFLDKQFNIVETKEEKGDTVEKKQAVKESDLDYLRFKSSRKEKVVKEKKSNLIPTLYLSVHLIVLFISIAIG